MKRYTQKELKNLATLGVAEDILYAITARTKDATLYSIFRTQNNIVVVLVINKS